MTINPVCVAYRQEKRGDQPHRKKLSQGFFPESPAGKSGGMKNPLKQQRTYITISKSDTPRKGSVLYSSEDK